MIALFVLIVMREAVKMRKHAGNAKVFEVSDEFDIYDWED